MDKFEFPGVQRLATKTPQHRNDFLARAGRQCESPAVDLAAPREPAAGSDVLDSEGEKPIIPRPEKAEES